MPNEDLRGFDVPSESDESLRERVGLLLVAASRSRPRDVELCVESCSENFGLDGAMLAEQGLSSLSGRFVASLAPITRASAESDESLRLPSRALQAVTEAIRNFRYREPSV